MTQRGAALVLADDGARELTYQALDQRACRAAARLRAHAIQAGERVALCAQNGLGFLDGYFGSLYAGCTVLLVPPMSAPAELVQRLLHARCRALIADQSVSLLAEQALALCPDVCRLEADSLSGGPDALDGPCAVAPESHALLLYTSGTTGKAKGALISHASLLIHSAALVHHELRLAPSDRVLATLPLSHSYGVRMALLAPFYAGATSVLLARFDPARVRSLLDQQSISWFPRVPAMFQAIADDAGGPRAAGALRGCLSAGAPLARDLRLRAEEQLGVRVLQGYGLTEATFSTLATPDDEGCNETVGRPVFGVELRIVDGDGNALPRGERGEICIRGPNVMAGYLDDPAESAAALRDGFLHSGDVGLLDEAGRLKVVDRLKDMILRNGFNVYPAEVEAVLVSHPGVREAAVVGVPDQARGEEILAALVPSGTAPLDLTELDHFCRQQLSATKRPRLYSVLAALPRGATGKVLRREIANRALLGSLTIAHVGGRAAP